MYIKRLAEILVQKAFLIFEILSFEVYCRSIVTLRLNDTGSRFSKMNISERNGDGRQTMHTALKIFKRSSLQRLKILSVLGDSAYIFLAL